MQTSGHEIAIFGEAAVVFNDFGILWVSPFSLPWCEPSVCLAEISRPSKHVR